MMRQTESSERHRDWEQQIAIGATVVLKVAGPALQPGACVGWSVSSGHVQINHAGFYQGLVEAVTRVGVGLRIAIRFGDARIHALVGYTDLPLAASVASTSIRTRRAYGLGIKALRLVARHLARATTVPSSGL